MVFVFEASAQDSLQKSSEPTNTTTINTQTTTSESARQRRRRKQILNDSLRFAIERDSLKKVAAANQANGVLPQTPVAPVAPVVTQPVPATPQKSDNPFDIQRGNETSATAQNNTPSAPSLLNKETYSKNFIFWVFLIVLILMAFVVAGGRSAIRMAYQAMTSDNALRQIYKEPMGWGSFGYLSLYFLFWINTGIFISLLLSYFKMKTSFSQFGTFIACVLGVSGLILLKHAVLYLIAKVFPVEKEIRTYNFIILTVGILLGLILMPINIFIAYAPQKVSTIFIYLGLLMIAVAYLVRSLRSLPVAAPFLIDNRFHFLLYLCTIEIAPLVVLTKFIVSNS
jgi:hypothetical protein